jgi:TetR/AcrR family transcriptional repressor of nem operon
LVKATGLLPGSIYARFGNKEGLFLECIEHYNAMATGMRMEHEEHASPMVRLRSFYDALLKQMLEDDEHRGCFIVNCSLESDKEDTTIKTKVRDCMAEGERWIALQLELAAEAGELKSGIDCQLVAGCLVGAFYGFRVMSRAEESRGRLSELAKESFDRLVGPWLIETEPVEVG